MQNDNQSDGIVLTKSADVNEDGTIDITIEAYTTGSVTSHEGTVPTDIVLVLDLSGSMSEKQDNTYKTEYVMVNGSSYSQGYRTYYGFSNNRADYYIKTTDNIYVPVHKEGSDWNRYDYYYSDVTGKYYYPILNSSITPKRTNNNYEVVQFYRVDLELESEGRVKLEILKEAVNKFIDETAIKNASISDDAKKHRISIIKFAGPQYYNSTTGNATAANAVLPANIGDNKYNRNEYNYTQVVKDLTIVERNTTSEELKTAVKSFTAGGATAIDYGLELAQHVFYDREAEEITNRNEVVIVFTDGEPTHGNSYSEHVAGNAVNFSYGLKSAGASVYTISVESNADASVLQPTNGYKKGNAFMHYLSSNYAEATADISTYNRTITPGEGSISSGYYMTPSANMNLDMIFNKIIHHIDNPTISLGTDATVHDHISPYFDLATNSTSDITLQTALRKADGTWANPVTEAGITATVTNDNTMISVKGFDFDKNFISDTPRDTNFYGKKLIITIKVKPDYIAIDADKSDIKNADGWIDTNNGAANITNTNGTEVAKVNSPKIQLHKITYKVDGEEYDYFYLMPNENHNLISEPNRAGYESSGWSSDDVTISSDSFTMPKKDVIVEGHYKYKVTYKYNVSPTPDRWPEIPDSYNQISGEAILYTYDTEVIVKDDLIKNNYVFKGWRMGNKNVVITGGTEDDVTSFIMPKENVELIAHFEPESGDKIYRVEHWLERIDSIDEAGYVAEYAYDSGDNILGKNFGRVYNAERHDENNKSVSASWVTYHGFKPIEGNPSVVTGTVNADNDLVLKLYYEREKYNVTYDYNMPVGVAKPEVPSGDAYYYGQNVTLKTAATIEGYEFTGWTTEDIDVNNDAKDNEFSMPNKDVKFVGTYKPADVDYEVEYYLQNLENNGYTLQTPTETYSAKTGARAFAELKQFKGFKFNEDDSISEGIVLANGSLVLKMYYDRLSYTVNYEWFEPQTEAVNTKYPTLPTSASYKYGQTFVVEQPLSNFTGSDSVNYSFDGWYSHDIPLNPNSVQPSYVMPANNVTILGRFNGIMPEEDPTVTYDEFVSGDKHNPEPAIDEVEKDKFIIVDPNEGLWEHEENGIKENYTEPVKLVMSGDRVLEAPTRDNHIFNGWKKYSDLNTLPDTNGYPSIADVEFVYIAQWSKTCVVSYDLNGGIAADGVDYSDKTVEVGTVVTVNEAPVRSGYTFIGWTAEGISYAAGDDVTVNDNITFVAQWSKNSNGGNSGGTTKYTLTYESNGGTEYEKEKYSRGEIVELTKTPEKEGFIFDGWHLDKGLNEDITSVTMNKNITVYANWIKEEVPAELNGNEHFAYIIGYPDGTVLPRNNITRAEVASIFFRLLKDEVREENLTSNNIFSDVSSDKWYNTAISTLASLGIITGRSDNTFEPNDYITRAEFAAICARFDDIETEVVNNFTDVAGHWAEKEICEATAYGWIKGYEDNTFRPDQSISRAEAMTLINRVLKREPETTEDLLDNMIKWPDNSDVMTWYYIAVQEATNSHKYIQKNNVYEKWTEITDVIDWTIYEK